jgi:hypothetical protein
MANHASHDERLLKTSLLRGVLSRPGLGAAGGAIAIWLISR